MLNGVMSICGYKRLTIILSLSCIVLVAISGRLFWNYGWLKIGISFASEQTQFFEEMQHRAMHSDTLGAVECLNQVVNYYPSGSKQRKGSNLDRIVERERLIAEREIIAYLRTKTGKDLGDRPESWVKKYGQN